MRNHIPDALAVVALVLITVGVALWSVPAALVVCGVGVALAAVYAARVEPAK